MFIRQAFKMYHSSKILVLCVTCTFFWIGYAYKREGILGGVQQEPFIATYHVAILSRRNFSSRYNVQCGGGIIDHKLVLSAAQCFMEIYGQLKELTFYIVVDTSDLAKTETSSIFEIDKIYMQNYTDINSFYDIAVVKMKKRFQSATHPRLRKLNIPHLQTNFMGRYGTLVGYECSNYHSPSQDNTTVNYVIRQVFIQVVEDVPARTLYSSFVSDMQVYGIILTDMPNQKWGLCYHDAGSPLVIDEHVVGIVSKVSYMGNDAIYGTVFTNVAPFYFWIDLLKYDLELGLSAFVFYNRPHVK